MRGCAAHFFARNKKRETMSLEQDLERIALQEEKLRFPRFEADTAWQVGSLLRAAAESRGLAVAIDIEVNGHLLFFSAMRGTTPDNLDWIRRKKNVVQRYHRSSYAVGLELKRDGTDLTERVGVAARDYAPHGGCFPIRLVESGCIGTITVSGLPQREDHNLVVEVLAGLLGVPLSEVALGGPDL
jgi:uncharacterized protein (UPF0303 family)